MERKNIENITEAMEYIESHLNEKLDLEKVAKGVHFSKYYLHRLFTDTAGVTLHGYIRRRKLTEAAKLLVFSKKPVLEIALTAGYESQQAFAGAFKAMYKQTPGEYREREMFYPLQLEFELNKAPSPPELMERAVSCAGAEDIPDWMEFVPLVIGGFPCLDQAEHLEQLRRHIEQKQALIMRDQGVMVGAGAFSRQTGSIDFLAVHPQYRFHGIEKNFLDCIKGQVSAGRGISITTFREGDKADAGQREAYKRLGFEESELLTEFGYPTQRLILPGRPSDNLSGDAKRRVTIHDKKEDLNEG